MYADVLFRIISAIVGTLLGNYLTKSLEPRASPETWYPSPVSWHACPSNLLTDPSLSLHCSSVEVPLNYTDPTAQKLALPLLRVSPPQGPSQKSILIEFDNPSISGRSQLAQWAHILLHLTGSEYNLVAWDTREDHIRPCYNAVIGNHDSTRICDDSFGFAMMDSWILAHALLEDGKIRYWGFGHAAYSGFSLARLQPSMIERMVIDGTPLVQAMPSMVETENPLLFLSRTDQWRPSWNESLQFTGSVLLRLDGKGPTSLDMPSSCALNAITNYWKLGLMPKQGALCPMDGDNMSWEDIFRQSSADGEAEV